MTYGSDAVAGVANFLTRKDFTGFEVSTSFEDIDASDADTALGFIWGSEIGDTGHLVVSVGQRDRSELSLRDLDWHTNQTYAVNPQGGYSGIGNPGTFYAIGNTNLTSTFLGVVDPGCEEVGGQIGDGSCRFRFTTFDNLKEDETLQQIFVEYNAEIGGGSFHFDFLSSETDVPSWKTSPSYPPQLLFGPVQRVQPDHPGYVAMRTAFPTELAPFSWVDSNGDTQWATLTFLGRTVGAGGLPYTADGAAAGSRTYETTRFHASYEFDTGDFSHRVDATIGSSDHLRTGHDAYIDRTQLAFAGYGGANCGATIDSTGTIQANGATAGSGNCGYINPFSNSIQYSAQFFSPNYVRTDGSTVTYQPGGTANPNYSATTANESALLQWIYGEYRTGIETETTVFGYSFQKDLFSLDGGEAVIAAGAQIRNYDHVVTVNDAYNLNLNPCSYAGQTAGVGSCLAPTGRFSFLSGTYPGNFSQSVTALFAELALPVSEAFDVQVAARYEEYENTDTFDPKVSLRWTPLDWLTVRASFSSSFRGPSAAQIVPNSKSTILQYVAPTRAFKAIDINTNPDLEPESADTTNIGVVFNWDQIGLTLTVDMWDFDFSNPIIGEEYNGIVNAYTSGDATRRAAVMDRILCQDGSNDCAGSAIARVTTSYVNGPSIQTNGVDVFAEWETNLGGLDFAVGGEVTTIDTYDVASYSIGGTEVIPAYDALGDLNASRSARPLPETKFRSWLRLSSGAWVVNVQVNDVSSYDDVRNGTTVASFATTDVNFSWTFDGIPGIDQLRAYVVVNNLDDKDPPFARTDLGYDAFTHNPFGRTIKAGVALQF